MSRLVPKSRRGWALATLLLLSLGVLLLPVLTRTASAAPYVNPWWANNSPSPKSAVPSVTGLAMTPEGVDARTGEFFSDHFLVGCNETSDPLGQHWAFTGRFFDEESGLYYYRARYYDSDVGRFLQRDPLGYSEGPSLFVYMRSNPTNSGDPSGLQDRDIEGYVTGSTDEEGRTRVEAGVRVTPKGFRRVLRKVGRIITWPVRRIIKRIRGR